MIISLLFEEFRYSSLDHLRLVYAVLHDCISGHGRQYKATRDIP